MAKFTFFLGALLTLAVCLPATVPLRTFAMGSKSGTGGIQRQEQKEPAGQGTEKVNGNESGTQKENKGGKQEKSPPQKKPRLKYRDPYECGC